MSHPNKVRGTRYESEMAAFLTEALGRRVERRSLKGNRDEGDLLVDPDWVAECKSAKEMRLGEWLDELRVEIVNARARYGAVLIKRRGKGAAGSYVLMPVEVLLRLLQEAA